MDPRRFDSIARSLAVWTSRRRFLAALTGAAAMPIIDAGTVSAANQDGLDQCLALGDQTFPNGLDRLAGKSKDLLLLLERLTSSDFTRPNGKPYIDPPGGRDGLQAYAFLGEIKCLLDEGTQAQDWASNATTLSSFIHKIRAIQSGFVLGFSGSSIPGSQDSRMGGVRALPDAQTPPNDACAKNACLAQAIDNLFYCLEYCVPAAPPSECKQCGSPNDRGCEHCAVPSASGCGHCTRDQDATGCDAPCFFQFIQDIAVGTNPTYNADGTLAKPGDDACLPQMSIYCDENPGACCLSSCNGCC